MASQLIKVGEIDFSNPINIVAHSMGAAHSAGMVEAFLEANPEAEINILLLAPDGAEQFDVDSRVNSAQFTFGDDGIVTDNTAVVGNVDVNLNTNNREYQPFNTKSLMKALKAHSAPIDDALQLDIILNSFELE
jgi:hypothetical protein